MCVYIRVSRSCRCIHYPPTSAHPHFTIQLLHRTHRRFSSVPHTSPRAGLSAGRPCEDEHRKMRVIKGKIFLCPAIGGCRGNTRATSASNYFQTLRIERALLRTARIARHTHFSRISVSLSSLSNNHLRFPPFRFPFLTLPTPSSFSRVLIVDGRDTRRNSA